MTKHLVGITTGLLLIVTVLAVLLAREPSAPPVAVAQPVIPVGLEKLKWGMTVEEVGKLYSLASPYVSVGSGSMKGWEHFLNYQWRGCQNNAWLIFDAQGRLYQVFLNIDHAVGKSCQSMAAVATEQVYGTGLTGDNLDPPRGTKMPDCARHHEIQFHSKLSLARCWKNAGTVVRLYDRIVENLVFAKSGVPDPDVGVVPELPI